MPLEPFNQPARLGGGERLIQRRWLMGVQIILDQHDLRGFRKMRLRQLFEDAREVRSRALIRDLDMPPALQRREEHEQIGRSIAPVLIIVSLRPAWFRLYRRARLRDQLFRRLIQAYHGTVRIVWPMIHFDTSSMFATNDALASGGMTNCWFRCGLTMF